MTVTFGLGYRKESPRIDVATEPYPGRWTHHVMVGTPDEIDEELMGWIQEAVEFENITVSGEYGAIIVSDDLQTQVISLV